MHYLCTIFAQSLHYLSLSLHYFCTIFTLSFHYLCIYASISTSYLLWEHLGLSCQKKIKGSKSWVLSNFSQSLKTINWLCFPPVKTTRTNKIKIRGHLSLWHLPMQHLSRWQLKTSRDGNATLDIYPELDFSPIKVFGLKKVYWVQNDLCGITILAPKKFGSRQKCWVKKQVLARNEISGLKKWLGLKIFLVPKKNDIHKGSLQKKKTEISWSFTNTNTRPIYFRFFPQEKTFIA